ncbi:MAG: hypothetical protein SOT80_00800 [Candidatus Pseudoruminococcus sp.]|nr:hypothetical protein [Candidatus Pseudoruminococcus sp.]
MTEKVFTFTIGEKKDFDIKISFPCETVVTANNTNQAEITITSEKVVKLEDCIKLKTNDTSSRFDMKIKANDLDEGMKVILSLPSEFVNKVELNGTMNKLSILDIKADNIEASGKISVLKIKDANSHIEINSNNDMKIACSDTVGKLDVNQISANSELAVSADTKFKVENKGRKTQIFVNDKLEQTDDCKLEIELNGMKSNLKIVNLD